MATLVPVADALAPGVLAPDATAARTTARGAHASTLRRARSRWLVSVAVLDVVSVLSCVVVTALAATRVAPGAIAATLLGWIALLAWAHGYDEVEVGGDRVRRRTRSVTRAGAALGLAWWVLPAFVAVPLPPGILMVATLSLCASAWLSRLAADRWWSSAVDALGGVRTLVAGDPESVERAVAELQRVGRWHVVSVCVTDAAGELKVDAPVIHGVDDLAAAAVAARADVVLVLPCRPLDAASVRRLGWDLESAGVRLLVGADLLDVAPARVSLVSVGDLGAIRLRASRGSAVARAVKQAFERSAAAILLVALLPVLVTVAIAVRRDSPGPAIFRQRRVGRDGAEFTMYKFRTMTTDAVARVADLAEENESQGAVLFKIRNDPRITRLGAFLRRYSIDELPQLVNVLRGDMALVGPRPGLPDEVARYDLDARRRLAARPGLTGLWQVSGRSDLSWASTVRLDLHYVDNWSLALDLKIACRTVRAVLGHNGAY